MFRRLILPLMLLVGLCVSNSAVSMPAVQRAVLPNQLVMLTSEDHSLPFVTFQLLLNAGSWRDPEGQEGLAYLTAKALLLGTSNRRAEVIHEELDFMGASLGASATKDYAEVSLRVLKKDLEKGFALFMEVLTSPSFPEQEIRREIEKTLAAIRSAEDQPDDVAQRHFERILFAGSPYGHPAYGTKESVSKLGREEVHRFFKTYYHPNNALLTIVGDIGPVELKEKILPRLEAWPRATLPDSRFEVRFQESPQTVKIDRNLTQANILIGHKGVERANPDYYALTVMNYILGGGGFSSRLVEEIRNKRGLAYSVASYFSPGKFPGSFEVSLQTKNSSAKEAISIVLTEIERIRKEGVSDQELEAAKKYLIGSFPMRLNTQAKLAHFLSQVEYYGLGLDYPEKYAFLIGSVTRDEVLRVARAYLHPEKLILVIVANLKEAGLE